MAVTTINITGPVEAPDSDAMEGASIRFILDKVDFDLVDDVTIFPETVSQVLDAQGNFTQALWPNSRGQAASRYHVVLFAGSSETLLGRISVPEAGAPHELSDLLAAGAPTVNAVYMGLITQGQYDAVQGYAIDAQAWAESPTAPGDPGTKSSKTWAIDAQAWAESPTAPGDPGTKSSKTWAIDAAASAVLADARADDAASFAGYRDYQDVATLLANTSLAYGPGAQQVVAGDVIRTRAEGFSYEVAAADAVDAHVTTAGGVKLVYATLGYSQDQTQYRTGGGAVRQAAAAGGWSFINVGGHEPWGWDSVALTGNNLRVTYDFTAAEVGTFSVTVDESYAAIGLTVGASVGANIADISGFAPISGRIVTGTGGIQFSSTSGNVTSQTVDQAAGTIVVVHGSQTHTDNNGSAVMVSDYAGSNTGQFVVSAASRTGFTLQYVRPLSCRITCTTATPGSEIFTVSQTENTGITAAWVSPGFLRITHPSIGNNFPAATVNLWRTSAAAYQFKIDSSGTTTDVYFLNADGTAVSVASTDMIIAFSIPGKFPAAIPGGSSTIGHVQRDMVPVNFDQLSGSSANLWMSFAHPIAP